MPSKGMQHSMMGSDGMKQSMMKGVDGMQKMQMTGDSDKDFAMMMKMHHQQGVEMAQMQIPGHEINGATDYRGAEQRDRSVRPIAG